MPKKRDTVGYAREDLKEPSSGVQVTVRFPASVFNRLNKTRKSLGIDNFRDVFVKAVREYFKVIQLVVDGHWIYVVDKLQVGDVDLDPGVSNQGFTENDNVEVVAEMNPRFNPEELRTMVNIQKLFQDHAGYSINVNEIVEEAIVILNWVVDKRLSGKKVTASKKQNKKALELPIDHETLMVRRIKRKK